MATNANMWGDEYSPEVQQQIDDALRAFQDSPEGQEAIRRAFTQVQHDGPALWYGALQRLARLDELERRVSGIEAWQRQHDERRRESAESEA